MKVYIVIARGKKLIYKLTRYDGFTTWAKVSALHSLPNNDRVWVETLDATILKRPW